MVGLDKSSFHTEVAVNGVLSSSKVLLHKLFHILGRYHENERTDRENYIEVIEKNIIEGVYMYIHMYIYTGWKNILVKNVLAFLHNMIYKNAI